MANDVIKELGFENGTTNSAFRNSLTQSGDEDEKKEEAGDEKKEAAGDDKKEAGGDDKKEGDAKKDGDAGDAKVASGSKKARKPK